MYVYRADSNTNKIENYKNGFVNKSNDSDNNNGRLNTFETIKNCTLYYLNFSDALKYILYKENKKSDDNSSVIQFDIPEEILKKSIGLGTYTVDSAFDASYKAIEFAVNYNDLCNYYKQEVDETLFLGNINIFEKNSEECREGFRYLKRVGFMTAYNEELITMNRLIRGLKEVKDESEKQMYISKIFEIIKNIKTDADSMNYLVEENSELDFQRNKTI